MSQTKEEMRKNILLNYENFLIEQKKVVTGISKLIRNKIDNYKNSYKAYFMDDLNPEKKSAYQLDLAEIAGIRQNLVTINEFLELFGIITEEVTLENLERLQQYKFDNARLKELEKKIKNSDDASKPQKENFAKEYQYKFVIFLAYIVLLIGIIVIAYIQISNRKQ